MAAPVGERDSLIVRVRLFAMARELGGAEVVSVVVPDRAIVGDVRRALTAACPELAAMADRTLIAVDAEYADDATAVTERSDVALIPPVSGG